MAALLVVAQTLGGVAHAQALPQPLDRLLPAAVPAGTSRLTYWGFAVYDASLWVSPAFRQSEADRHSYALELSYLRAFSAADIARRSIDEMRRAGEFGQEQAARWLQALGKAFPDVQKGDRIIGLHRPGGGVQFFFNGKKSGEIADPQFARLFFAIWLGPRTSEPALRDALLEGTAP